MYSASLSFCHAHWGYTVLCTVQIRMETTIFPLPLYKQSDYWLHTYCISKLGVLSSSWPCQSGGFARWWIGTASRTCKLVRAVDSSKVLLKENYGAIVTTQIEGNGAGCGSSFRHLKMQSGKHQPTHQARRDQYANPGWFTHYHLC